MKENTRQHYVPQYYLKQFIASGDVGIYLYDKKHSKEYYGSLGKVCCINDFYTLDEKFSNGDLKFNPKAVEHDYFADYIESEYKDTLNEIQNFINQWKVRNQQFPELLRSKLATFIVIQFLRLPDARSYMKRINDGVLSGLVPFFQKIMSAKTGNKVIEELNIKASYDPNRIDYKYYYGNPDFISRMAEA